MANIKEVAKKANTSITTVSRVINNNGYVKDQTRKRVLEAIKDLKYDPNLLARGLVTKKTQTFGLVIPDITNPFFAAIAKEIENSANNFGYSVFLCNTDGNLKKEKQYINAFIQRGVDGIIYATSSIGIDNIKKIKKRGMPIVVLDRQIENLHIDTVSINNFQGAFMATEYLIKLGRRNIAFIGGPIDIVISKQRKLGYMKALEQYRIEPNEDMVYDGHFKMESGIDGIKYFCNKKVKIDALFAANDLTAIGALNYLMQQGKRVPNDISIVGFDNIMLSSMITPKLTTINQPVSQMSEIAIELLIDQISKKKINPREIMLTPEIIIRESTSKVLI